MGKKREEKVSHQIRVNADLGEMIAWIARVEDVTTSQLLDPMLRAQVLARYKKHEPVIEKLQAAENALRKADASRAEARLFRAKPPIVLERGQLARPLESEHSQANSRTFRLPQSAPARHVR